MERKSWNAWGGEPEPTPVPKEGTLSLLWLKLRRLAPTRPTATADHEGQLRYDRDGDVDGKVYVSRYVAGGTYEWKDMVTAATPPASTIIVKEENVIVDAAAGTLDFDGSDFNVTSAPAGEANISLAYGTGVGTPAEGNHAHAALYQPLDADLTVIAGLVDPNVDRILFWDDSAGAYAYLAPGTNLTITGTTIDAAGGGATLVQSNDVSVALTANTLDFSNAFSVTESPANEANIDIDTRSGTFAVAYPPKFSGSITISDASLAATNRIVIWRIVYAADGDEMEMDAITFQPNAPTAGSCYVGWVANPGPILGTYAYRYIIVGT